MLILLWPSSRSVLGNKITHNTFRHLFSHWRLRRKLWLPSTDGTMKTGGIGWIIDSFGMNDVCWRPASLLTSKTTDQKNPWLTSLTTLYSQSTTSSTNKTVDQQHLHVRPTTSTTNNIIIQQHQSIASSSNSIVDQQHHRPATSSTNNIIGKQHPLPKTSSTNHTPNAFCTTPTSWNSLLMLQL